MAKQSTEETAAPAAAQNSMGAMGFGDISMIRNILMGQQIATWEEKFTQVDGRQDKDLTDLTTAIRSLESSVNQRLLDLEKRVEDRFSLLEAMTNDRFQKLNQKLDDNDRADRHALGQMLAEVSAKLLT